MEKTGLVWEPCIEQAKAGAKEALQAMGSSDHSKLDASRLEASFAVAEEWARSVVEAHLMQVVTLYCGE